MRIERIIGTAFGPFRGEILDLAPGFNVVHGPNEAGKSSWFNATYAALAGRRKYKGKGTAAETEYKNRHKPWSGSEWTVGLAVTLDNNRVLAIEQDLAKGEWRIVDGATERAVSDTDLLTDGSLDGTRLLGLNRHSARSTIFTGQADILRVRDDAGELQELLERVASTGATDATADTALTWLKERRSEWVGVAHIGSKPLRSSHTALKDARALAETRRDDHGELLEAIANRRKLAAALEDARAKVELSNRLVKWQSVYDLRGRVEKAVELSTRLAETEESDLAIDEAKLAAAAKILVVFDGGADVVPLGEGPTAADLQVQIDELPHMPKDDLEPRPDVIDAYNELVKAQTALDTHMQAAPPDVPAPPPTALSADDLRTLADVLASKPPEVDTAAVAAFQRVRAERAAQIVSLQREVDERNAAYLLAKADYDAALANGIQAQELEALHSAERSAAEQVIAAARSQSDFLLEALSAQEVQAGVMAQEVALRQHQERVGAARAQVRAELLDTDPDALKRLARAIDDARAARILAAKHAENAGEFLAARDDRVRTLSRLLGQADHAEITEDFVALTIQRFTEYVDVCKTRAGVAQQAARRPDLVEAYTHRQQLEASHQQALAAREAQGRDVVDFAAAVGLNAESLEAASSQLRRWVSEQEAKRVAFTERKTDVALLEQLLGGRELADLKSDLATQTANAGDEPDVPMPPNLNAFVAEAKDRHDRMINLDGQLKGRIQALGNALGSVAEAAEAEADALRAVTQVETLASCLDAATAELKNAKERANASIAPALANRMRPWLPRVTNGRYQDVTVDPGDLTIQVTETTGQVRQADRLSLGTTEQIYLLLRVTLSQVLSGSTETAPLIFDDVTTQSDNTRTLAVMKLLHELSTEHQVILFTQEDEVVEWAQRNINPARDRIIALRAP
ncbi:AAA family ATPase [Mycolicibacterium monacense]|uniref:AAA family ATPase n=1 Tax=Mycolicibacterium monacense TaxID=85693 RepID=UPI0007EB22E7|nr:AAA family ATPase [Mycolicibacterium monacense]OBF48801.1 chromosome segregation protein SMC [Mycolicibacterium monacense]